MSTFGSPGGSQKQSAPRPPEKGSFPLDHDGECTAAMTEYLNCMKKAQNDNSVCREQSKRYLECRMDRGLMMRDSLRNLGFESDKVREEMQQKKEA